MENEVYHLIFLFKNLKGFIILPLSSYCLLLEGSLDPQVGLIVGTHNILLFKSSCDCQTKIISGDKNYSLDSCACMYVISLISFNLYLLYTSVK